MNPMAKLREYTAMFAARCKECRWGAAAFHVGVQLHLLSDITEHTTQVRDDVYSEQQRNLMNAEELAAILADGEVCDKELPLLRKLADRERHSAMILQNVTEKLG
jgi:hypothetical protein